MTSPPQKKVLHFFFLKMSASPRTKRRNNVVKSSSTFWSKFSFLDPWLASDPSKRAAERFFLLYSIVWIALFSTIVATKVYLWFGDVEFMALGLVVALPNFLVPLLFPFEEDANIPFGQRFYVVANVWIAIFSYVGNYFWTHYFYVVLRASYSFPVQWQLNQVPFFLYLVTHGYFIFYHTMTTVLLRWWYSSSPVSRPLSLTIVVVSVMSIVTSFMETWTISSVPYYTHEDKWSMYTVGSVVYGIYFYVSFPMYHRVQEERTAQRWNATKSAIDSLAASMLVTIALDLYRLIIQSTPASLPWLHK